MSLAYMDAAPGSANTFRPAPSRTGKISVAVPAALISIGLHALAVALWQPNLLSVFSGDASGDAAQPRISGLVIDLGASAPAPSPAPSAVAPPPLPAGDSARARARAGGAPRRRSCPAGDATGDTTNRARACHKGRNAGT